jgi:hypothetical protein
MAYELWGLNLEIDSDKSYFAETIESSMQGRDWEVSPTFGEIFELETDALTC